MYIYWKIINNAAESFERFPSTSEMKSYDKSTLIFWMIIIIFFIYINIWLILPTKLLAVNVNQSNIVKVVLKVWLLIRLEKHRI